MKESELLKKNHYYAGSDTCKFDLWPHKLSSCSYCVLIFSKFLKGKISCDRSRLRIRDAEDDVEEIKTKKFGSEGKGFTGPSK
jgi:hypothetical protein